MTERLGGLGLQTIRFGPICKAGVCLISKFSHPLGAREFRLRPPPCYNWRVLPYEGVQASVSTQVSDRASKEKR